MSALVKFCLRRLAPEGLLPKPPQTSGLELFVSYPRHFSAPETLKEQGALRAALGRKQRRGLSKDKFRCRKKLLIRRQSPQNENTQRIIRCAAKKIKFRLWVLFERAFPWNLITRSSGIYPNFSVLNWAFILSFRLLNFAWVFKTAPMPNSLAVRFI